MSSATLGWDFVPPTVLRSGPHGRGSVQLYVDVDADEHFFTFAMTALPAQPAKLSPFSISSPTTRTRKGRTLPAHGRWLHHRHRPGPLLPRRTEATYGHLGFRRAAGALNLRFPIARLADELDEPDSETVQALHALLFEGEIAALRRRTHELVMAECFQIRRRIAGRIRGRWCNGLQVTSCRLEVVTLNWTGCDQPASGIQLRVCGGEMANAINWFEIPVSDMHQRPYSIAPSWESPWKQGQPARAT